MSRRQIPVSGEEKDMITEIITFAMPNGLMRDEVVADYRRSAPTWRANPDLIRKNRGKMVANVKSTPLAEVLPCASTTISPVP
jgi:hypothetical protein